jgi:tetratricopeptide (TPR) repeat protein
MTVQPSVPFWDCGEFSAAAIWQQVPHPPGAPLFLLLGKLFHIIIPFGDPGWKINLVAVFSSAFVVLISYRITVMLIENFRGKPKEVAEALAVYGSSFIGAAALVFSDTFWFNAVESEVYATSTLFVAVILYLIMKWNVEADKPGHERYLLLIMYVIGLSTGVHLLSILTIFTIFIIVYFRKYEFNWKSFIIMGGMAVITFFIIYPFIVKYIPAFLAGHSAGRNAAREFNIENSMLLTLFAIGTIIAAMVGFWWSRKNNKHILMLITGSYIFVILGYTTYTQILIRSNANPPMNENEPKTFTRLASYLGREQYGDAPMWPRRYQTDDHFVRRYEEQTESGEYVYGPWYPPGRKDVTRKDGTMISVSDFDKINSAGEFAYLWKYQMNHMYFRYFGWNFVGRKSDVQDAGVANFSTSEKEVETLNYGSGYAHLFPIKFFALPLLIGILGLYFHFVRDRKMAFAFLVAFLMMGVLTAIAQNQQDPQPRERDYFYAGSFVIWTMWIGMGTFGLIEYLSKEKFKTVVAAGIMAITALAAPVNMAIGGWKLHSRAGNTLPFDYSYNILQSVEENAIVFTNGDNDTFPVWYLQDVMGVRRDVRIVNLSLGNTLWYIDQLKNREPWGADKVPLSFADDSIQVDDESAPEALSYDFAEPMNMAIPVKREILERYTDDPAILEDGHMRFVFEGKPYGEFQGKTMHLIRVQDKVILDILQQVRFERPVYFSNTVGPDAFAGLSDFFRYEGMAMRICPVKQNTPGRTPLDPEIMDLCLIKNVDNSDNYSKTPQYGFKFRNLNNPDVYYDEVHRRLMSTYRSLYLSFADYHARNNNAEKAGEIIATMNEMISPKQFPMEFEIAYRMLRIYENIDQDDAFMPYSEPLLDQALQLVNNQDLREDLIYYEMTDKNFGPHRMAGKIYAMRGDYDKAIEMYQRLKSNVSAMLESIRGSQYQREQQMLTRNLFDIEGSIEIFKVEKVYKDEGIEAARQKAAEMMSELDPTDQRSAMIGSYIQSYIQSLNFKEGTKDTTAELETQNADM